MNFLENKSAVIFDFDGTLYSKKKFAVNLVFSNLLQMFRMKAERNIRKKFKGKYFGSGKNYYSAFYKELSKATGMKEEKCNRWYKEFYLPAMIKILQKSYKAFPEVEQIFKSLNQNNIKIIVYSDYPFVKERLSAVGIDYSLVDLIENAEDLGGLKPAEEPFIAIAEKINVKPENILVAGDRQDTDGEGARRSGMSFIHVTEQTPLATYFSQYLPS